MKGRLSSPLPREVLISRTTHRNNACGRLSATLNKTGRRTISAGQVKHDTADGTVAPRSSQRQSGVYTIARLPIPFRKGVGL